MMHIVWLLLFACSALGANSTLFIDLYRNTTCGMTEENCPWNVLQNAVNTKYRNTIFGIEDPTATNNETFVSIINKLTNATAYIVYLYGPDYSSSTEFKAALENIVKVYPGISGFAAEGFTTEDMNTIYNLGIEMELTYIFIVAPDTFADYPEAIFFNYLTLK